MWKCGVVVRTGVSPQAFAQSKEQIWPINFRLKWFDWIAQKNESQCGRQLPAVIKKTLTETTGLLPRNPRWIGADENFPSRVH